MQILLGHKFLNINDRVAPLGLINGKTEIRPLKPYETCVGTLAMFIKTFVLKHLFRFVSKNTITFN